MPPTTAAAATSVQMTARMMFLRREGDAMGQCKIMNATFKREQGGFRSPVDHSSRLLQGPAMIGLPGQRRRPHRGTDPSTDHGAIHAMTAHRAMPSGPILLLIALGARIPSHPGGAHGSSPHPITTPRRPD